jgi:hypothetical protein
MFANSQPTNFNLLQRNNYKIVINRLPATIFYTQNLKTPEISFPEIAESTPFININFAATKLLIGHLEFTFKIDEDMQNYREIMTWMRGLGFPDNTLEYRALKYSDNPDGTKGIKSDCSVQVITSSNVPNKEIYFFDIFPVFLSGLSFDTKNTNVNYMDATVRFSVRDFVINDVIS